MPRLSSGSLSGVLLLTIKNVILQTEMIRDKEHTPSYGPIKHFGSQSVAVAIQASEDESDSPPKIIASGRGALAEQILEIAFANGIKVREDCDLAQLLAQLELDTPIPSEAILIVAEILAKVYEANEAASRPTP